MIPPASLFASLPVGLRTALVECYQEIVRNYVEHRWEPAELNGGKLCEVVYTVLDGATCGTFAAAPGKPAKMVDACRSLEGRPSSPSRVGDRSLRVLIPRLLPFLYEIRNNRGVGHVGGDVDPNHADAEAVLSMANWIMAELVRVFHGVSLAEAQAAVDSLVERRHPLVWQVEDTKRVLDPKLNKADQSLVLLYSEPGWVEAEKLLAWVEYSSQSTYKKNVLKTLHDRRLIEFDQVQARARITPLGVRRVEQELLTRP
jgi:hypothetical protein